MALRMGETANFPGHFTAQSPKFTNSRTFHSRERPVSNSRTFPVFPVVWEPCVLSCHLKIDKTKVLMENDSLMPGDRKYCRMLPLEHSAIFFTCIKR